MRIPNAIGLATLAVGASAATAPAQTSFLLNFGFTDVPVQLGAEPGAPLPTLMTGGADAEVFAPAGNVSLTEFDGAFGTPPTRSTALDFDPAPFDPNGPGLTFEYFENPIEETITGSLTITDADGDRIVAEFVGETTDFLPTLVDASITSFDFIASGDGTNDSTFDDPEGNAFRADNLFAPEEAEGMPGTVQFTTTLYSIGNGVSLVQGRVILVPSPAAPLAAAIPAAALVARRRRR